jgi:hypothetical protein
VRELERGGYPDSDPDAARHANRARDAERNSHTDGDTSAICG